MKVRAEYIENGVQDVKYTAQNIDTNVQDVKKDIKAMMTESDRQSNDKNHHVINSDLY